jgi:NAD(P)-dependent dehydrogenase (short-subunit alcohol dehydrogenase family)
MTQLKDARILLTGASRGVGLAAARALISEGSHVLGVARDAGRLKEAEKHLKALGPGTFTALCQELTVREAPAVVASFVEGLWGALDIVVHNAGISLAQGGGIMTEPEGHLETTLDANLLAPFRLSRALLPLLKLGHEPRLINVGSGAGTFDGILEPGIASYRLSKWAVNGLTMLQAKELRGVVSVHAFDPGWIRTDLGGPNAPGTPEEAAAGLLKALQLPWSETGQFHKDGHEIPW